MKYDIFISYSRKDIEFAKSVCAVLDEFSKYYSFKYFFDTSAIKSREEYLNRIAGAIVESKTLLFIASQSAYESEFCAKELLFADKRSIPIHQYRIDDAKIPDVLDLLLGTHQYREADATSIESFVREVLADALGYEVLSLEEIKEQQRLRSLEQREQEEQKRQLQIAKEREMREKIEQLTSRRRDILAEIVECEKTLAGLTREKDFVEKDIADLRRSLAEKEDGGHGNSGAGNGVTSAQTSNEAKSVLLSIGKWLKWGLYSIILGLALLFAIIIIDVACDNENESNSEVTVPTKTYKVGDYYDDGTKRGVVFAVSDDGRHGKIISIDQTKTQWRKKSDNAVGVLSISNGKANTDAIMDREDAPNYPAFTWCRAKGKEWYLPSKEELELLYKVKDEVNKTLQDKSTGVLKGFYWSSTEDDEFRAWYVSMSNGDTYNAYKYGNFYVRAVAAF